MTFLRLFYTYFRIGAMNYATRVTYHDFDFITPALQAFNFITIIGVVNLFG